MHICFVMPDYHSARGGGGVESYVGTVAPAMTDRGHQVTVVALGQRTAIYWDGPVKVVEVRAPRLHWYLYRSLPLAKSLALPMREIEWSRRAWSALEKLHREDPVDAVEAGEMLVLQQLVAGQKPPLVVRGHGNRLGSKKFSGVSIGVGDWLGRRLELQGIRRAAALTAVSDFQATELSRELSVPNRSINVIPNPISPVLLDEAMNELNSEPEEPVVLYTGRIEYRKGTIPMLRSVSQVASVFPDVRYVIAGGRHNSIDDATLNRELDRDNARAHVQLLGHVPWQQLADWYRRARVFVMPSYYETFGISAIEAMAFRLPVVATTAGGLLEVVEDGVTGILVPPGDPQALAEAITRLLHDRDLRERMGKAGRERVLAEFTVERIVDMTLSIYKGVVNQQST